MGMIYDLLMMLILLCFCTEYFNIASMLIMRSRATGSYNRQKEAWLTL